MGDRIQSFEELRSWQDSTDFAVEIYKITKTYPKEEQFGITNQLRRASAGIPANIAEGFGRRTSKDKIHFYTIAYGSILEIKSFLYLSEKLAFIDNEALKALINKATSLQKMIHASQKALRE